jgi:NitT/TauT family transport system substrate-binding protein
MLLANDVPEHKVKILNIPPADFASALQSGKVDAVTAFSPYKDEIQTIFGNQLTITFGEDLYVSRFNLIAKQEYLKRHPEIAHKVLAALNEAIQYMMNHPNEAYKIIGKQLKLEAPQVAEILSTRDFNLILEQSLLLNLDEQTRWAIKKELVGIRSTPNYLDHIDYKPLLLVNPNGVEIIH